MSGLGLVLEILLFALGLYLYLFARGFIKVKDVDRAAKAEAFRQDNATWMRLLGLALAAIMFFNILAHLREMF